MNDQQIYALMARTPDIRAVQICDALDEELVDVSSALRSLVEVGDVVKHSGTGPNGQPAQMYNLSETFKKSREGQALLATAAATTTTAPAAAAEVPDPLPGPTTTPNAFPTPVFSKQGELKPARSKVDLAIEHLKIHKSATDAEMRTVMGLPKTSAPKAYLKSAIDTGRVARNEDGSWELGDGNPRPKPSPKSDRTSTQLSATPGQKDVDNVVSIGNIVVVSRNSSAVPEEVIAAVAAAAEPFTTVATNESPVFRCGLWSDDVLELQRNGQQVAVLTRREGEQLVDFMERMLGQVEKTAA